MYSDNTRNQAHRTTIITKRQRNAILLDSACKPSINTVEMCTTPRPAQRERAAWGCTSVGKPSASARHGRKRTGGFGHFLRALRGRGRGRLAKSFAATNHRTAGGFCWLAHASDRGCATGANIPCATLAPSPFLLTSELF